MYIRSYIQHNVYIYITIYVNNNTYIYIYRCMYVCMLFRLNIRMLFGKTYREREGWAGCKTTDSRPCRQVMWAMATCKKKLAAVVTSHFETGWLATSGKVWPFGNVTWQWLPSGNQTWLAGKSILNGGLSGKIIYKWSINGGCSIAMFDYREGVYPHFRIMFSWKIGITHSFVKWGELHISKQLISKNLTCKDG